MKFILSLAVGIFAVLTGFAYPSMFLKANVMVSLDDAEVLSPEGIQDTIAEYPKWMNGKKSLINITKELSTEDWLPMGARFRVSKDGVYALRIGSVTRMKVNYGVYYDEIRLNGQLIPNGDFEDGVKNVYIPPKTSHARFVSDPGIVPSGKKCMYVAGAPVLMRMNLKKGVDYALTLSVRSAGPEQVLTDVIPLSLAEVANMGFVDEVIGDGKGGWSDQGPYKDMKDFDACRLCFGSMEFVIQDPVKNNGKSILTLDSEYCKTGVRKARLDLKGKNVAGKYLYLLHSAAWLGQNNDVGTITFTYNDGSSLKFDVRSNRDLSDWGGFRTFNNCKPVYTRKMMENNSLRHATIYMSRFPLKAETLTSITFETARKSVWMVVGASVSSRTVAFEEKKDVIFTGKEWKVVDFPSPVIPEGSIIDLSNIFPKGQAGDFGPVQRTADGIYTFAGSGQPARFLGSGQMIPVTHYKPFRERFGTDFDAHCRQLKRQGYNLVRFYTTPSLLEDPKDKTKEVKEYVDLIDRIFAACKHNGIYVNVVLSPGGCGTGEIHWESINRQTAKVRWFIQEPELVKWWKTHATRFLTRTNPYTGIAYKDDPAIICLDFYNEPGVGLVHFNSMPEKIKKLYEVKWQLFLTDRYKTVDALNRSWGDRKGVKSFQAIGFPLQGGYLSPQQRDWAHFIGFLSDGIMKLCIDHVRSVGYKGEVAAFNYLKDLQQSATRSKFNPTVEANVYFSHPSIGIVARNTVVPQSGSIQETAPHFRLASGTRLACLPIIVTEQQHCFWNPYVYENGLIFPAYSALQNFSGIMAHADPSRMNFDVERWPDKKLHPSKLQPFTIVNNPVFRANELMAALLFLRGDVKASKHRVDIEYTEEYMMSIGNPGPNPDQVKLSLLAGFALRFPHFEQGIKVSKADIVFKPAKGAEIRSEDFFTEIKEDRNKTFELASAVALMKKKGILPSENLSNPEAGVWHSDTGEILLNSKSGKMTVITPKSEGVCMYSGNRAKLNVLNVLKNNRDSNVFVSAMDGRTLKESRRLLLAYVTEVANSGMKLSPDRSTCLEPGRSPALMLTGSVELELLLPNRDWTLYAVSTNGIRREKLSTTYRNSRLCIKLDTAMLKNGPSPFFELTANH